MKKTILLLVAIMFAFNVNAQTRKTRSDKGGTHSHTSKYYVKKAVKSTTSTSNTKATRRRKK